MANRDQFGIAQIGIPAAIAIGLAVLAAFWALSDPRAEIANIKTNYLTIREHEEFKNRIDRDIIALRTDMATHDRIFVNRQEFEAWVRERDKNTAKTAHQLQRLEESRPTQGELNIAIKALEVRVQALENARLK